MRPISVPGHCAPALDGREKRKKMHSSLPCGKQNKKSFPHFSWQGDRQSAHAHPFHFLLVQGVSFMEDRTWPHIVRCIYLCRCSAVIYASIYAVIYAVNMHVLCNCRYADALEERSTSRRMCLRGFRSDSGRHGSKQGATERNRKTRTRTRSRFQN